MRSTSNAMLSSINSVNYDKVIYGKPMDPHNLFTNKPHRKFHHSKLRNCSRSLHNGNGKFDT